MGIPDRDYDYLPHETFPGREKDPRCQMTFDGAGVVLVAERVGVHSCEIATLREGVRVESPRLTLMSQIEYSINIPSIIASY